MRAKYARLAYFPLYNFGISFIKLKWPAARQIWFKLIETFFGGYLGIYPPKNEIQMALGKEIMNGLLTFLNGNFQKQQFQNFSI